MTFHRLAVPTYFGGLPAGYDLINDPSHPSVGGSGVPALADGIKSGGPNDGTYLVAFREDGTSENTNRPAVALAENCDAIDDILRTSIPTVTFVDATAAGAVSTHALVAEVYVGKNGAANDQAQRDRLIRITDQNNNDLEVSGTKIIVTSIHNGSNVNVVGTLASGFRTNASINVSPPIPNGTTYRVWFGTRNTYADISLTDKGALFEHLMRVINNIPGEVRSLFRQIHSESSVNQAFDAAFDSTIRSLASAGLNERYRRATTQPAGFVSGDYNQAGGGAIILRDGQAVTINTADTGSYPDKNLAALKVKPVTEKVVQSGFTAGKGGDFGYWHESEFKSYTTSGTEVSRTASSGPALIEVYPRDVRTSTVGGNNIYTKIDNTADAIINPDSDNGPFQGPQTIQAPTGQFFGLTGPGRTAVRCGYDLLEVTYSGVTETYIIGVVSGNRALLYRLTGQAADFGNVAITGVRIRWLQASVKIGGFLNLHSQATSIQRALTCVAPAILTDDPGDEVIGACAMFAAVSDEAGNLNRTRALEWGTHQLTGGLLPRGSLTAEGGIYAVLATLTGALEVGGTAAITGNTTISGSVTAGQAIVSNVRELVPERFYHLREDFINFQQTFTPDLIWATQSTWTFDEVTDVFTLNNGTPTAKNPGRLEIIGAGGSTSRFIAIYPTALLPFAFSGIQEMTVVIKVQDDGGNVATSFGIGFMDTPAFQNGGDDSLFVFYTPSLGWRLTHRSGGANAANHNTNLGTFVANQFVTIRFLKQSNGDLQVTFNGSVVTTVLAANLPAGLCTFVANAGQSVADAGASTFTVDFVDLIADTGSNRNGA